MLMEVDIEELVNVILGAFPLQEIVMMFTEDDLAAFFKKFVETLLSSDWEFEERKIREWVVERDER